MHLFSSTGFSGRERRPLHMTELPNAPQEQEPLPEVSDFQLIENAAEKLLPAVEAAREREAELNKLTPDRGTEEVNQIAAGVTRADVERASREVERIEKELKDTFYVVSVEMPKGVDMKLQFPSQQELIDFMLKYKQAAEEDASTA